MSNLTKSPDMGQIEKVLITGDLSPLTAEQRTNYYMKVCESVGLNPLTKPFEYIKLNGKLTLYATRSCTDQLRKNHNVSINITDRKNIDGVYVVTAKAKLGEREDESTGAVHLANLNGDPLANAFMKAETKAKRRVTLSICGLGLLDESEVETIKDTRPVEPIIKPPQNIEDVKDSIQSENSDVFEPANYQLQVGKKWAGRKLKEVPVKDLSNWRDYLSQNKRDQKGQTDLEMINAYLNHGSMEHQ